NYYKNRRGSSQPPLPRARAGECGGASLHPPLRPSLAVGAVGWGRGVPRPGCPPGRAPRRRRDWLPLPTARSAGAVSFRRRGRDEFLDREEFPSVADAPGGGVVVSAGVRDGVAAQLVGSPRDAEATRCGLRQEVTWRTKQHQPQSKMQPGRRGFPFEGDQET